MGSRGETRRCPNAAGKKSNKRAAPLFTLLTSYLWLHRTVKAYDYLILFAMFSLSLSPWRLAPFLSIHFFPSRRSLMSRYGAQSESPAPLGVICAADCARGSGILPAGSPDSSDLRSFPPAQVVQGGKTNLVNSSSRDGSDCVYESYLLGFGAHVPPLQPSGFSSDRRKKNSRQTDDPGRPLQARITFSLVADFTSLFFSLTIYENR